MKISELRENARKSRPEDLQKALALVYKSVPKAKKEELDQDLILILEGKQTPAKKKKEEFTDFETLKQQIELFIDDVMNGYYYRPNRIIPKSQRSKWRFAVKRYYKALLSIDIQNKHYDEANQLLSDLYRMMCHGCMYYIFNTNDTFMSAQIEQNDFFSAITERIFRKSIDSDTIHTLLDLAVVPGLSYDSLETEHIYIVFHFLNTDDAFRAVITESGKIIAEKEKKAAELEKTNSFSASTDIFYLHDSCDKLALAVMMAASSLGTAAEEFSWYFRQSSEKDKEISLYCVIMYCFRYLKDYENIVAVYDFAVKEYGIEPRDELKEIYHNAKKFL